MIRLILRTLKLVTLFAILAVSVFSATLESPDGNLKLTVGVNTNGQPVYSLSYKNKPVIETSRLGFELKGGNDLSTGFKLDGSVKTERDRSWDPVWGEVKTIRDHHRELEARFVQSVGENNREIVVRFRLFNDGLGFRYEFPEQKDLRYFEVVRENTEFDLTGDHMAFWIPGDFDTNEYPYSETKLSEIDAEKVSKVAVSISTRSNFSGSAVQTPLMLKTESGLYINIHEAALINYPAICLNVDKKRFVLSTELAPNTVGSSAHLQTPARTPWRTVLVSDDARDLIASKTILNLNEPTKLRDTNWIRPQKFIGIWWELHVNKSSWNYSDTNNIKIDEVDWKTLKPNGRHGATTENTKRYIDFAAKNGIDSVLVEGWNVGWEDWFGNWKDNVFDFVTPYPDFDVDAVTKYAAEKRVRLVMHHETSASVTNYERRLDRAFTFMNKNGYEAVKTGYVGRIIPRGELHDGQYMVNHYNHVAERAGEYKIMIDSHESVRPTGLHRTYPNWLTAEAARGNEFNAWSAGNPPAHETILPFTRLMGGPMDYTPGIFEIKMNFYDPAKTQQVHTTLAKQLALYVTMYSPMQMAADLPENYEKYMDAFEFIKDVPVDWDETRVIAAEPGDFIVIARRRKGGNGFWYLGAITDENARTIKIPLDFLRSFPNGERKQVAKIYADSEDAHWETNPKSYRIYRKNVRPSDTLELDLAPGGGAAVRFLHDR
ncbi:MAG: glycoside hydrolase family 97 protein [Acidobacteriota bacterium]|nr:glycoside hydrolase family 97 protein [Acidobacteriota bacterium]